MENTDAPENQRSAYLDRVDLELQRLRHIIVQGAIPSECVGEIFLLGMEVHPLAGAPCSSALPH